MAKFTMTFNCGQLEDLFTALTTYSNSHEVENEREALLNELDRWKLQPVPLKADLSMSNDQAKLIRSSLRASVRLYKSLNIDTSRKQELLNWFNTLDLTD